MCPWCGGTWLCSWRARTSTRPDRIRFAGDIYTFSLIVFVLRVFVFFLVKCLISVFTLKVRHVTFVLDSLHLFQADFFSGEKVEQSASGTAFIFYSNQKETCSAGRFFSFLLENLLETSCDFR